MKTTKFVFIATQTLACLIVFAYAIGVPLALSDSFLERFEEQSVVEVRLAASAVGHLARDANLRMGLLVIALLFTSYGALLFGTTKNILGSGLKCEGKGDSTNDKTK